MKWIIGIYVGIGVYLTIIRAANPASLTRWMNDGGVKWYIGFLVHSLTWPLVLTQMRSGEWSGYRPINWASTLGMMLLPKRIVWVNAIHPYHPQGHYRFEVRAPLMDIAEYAENGELYALQSDNWNRVGCANTRPRNVVWANIPGIDAHNVDWNTYIAKSEYDKFITRIERLDDALSKGDLSGINDI